MPDSPRPVPCVQADPADGALTDPALAGQLWISAITRAPLAHASH